MIVRSTVGGTLRFRIGGSELVLSPGESVDLSSVCSSREIHTSRALEKLFAASSLCLVRSNVQLDRPERAQYKDAREVTSRFFKRAVFRPLPLA